MILYDIIRRPLITEKPQLVKKLSISFHLRTLGEIRVETGGQWRKFSMSELPQYTIQVKGKVKQRGKIVGKRKDWKKQS